MHKLRLFINPLCIGITGSFGKTSTKYFINNLVQESFLTTASPKSYNTEMGLCKSILDNLRYGDEIYIAELGATKPKDIEKLINIVNVDIGIITDIGIQHLESFKTIDNILNTKLEILKSPSIQTLIINNDNKLLREYNYPNNINIIRVGTDKTSDILINHVKTSLDNIEFDIKLDKDYHIKTKIIGKHNVINIALAVTIAYYLGIDIYQVIEKVKEITPVDHRLQVSYHGIHQIIDNSFNSNIQGFKNNIDLLTSSKNFKILITPGVVELASSKATIHKELARYINNKVDFVYLVDNTNTIYMKEEFDKIGFNNYLLVDSFINAYRLALQTTIPSSILIENDLTDYYMNGGK